MMPNYKELDVGFSAADADQPTIEYRDGELFVRFVDWKERVVAIRFPSAVAFMWRDETLPPPASCDDAAYEVLESPWQKRLFELGADDGSERHYKLCFNAWGVLEVVSWPLVTDIA